MPEHITLLKPDVQTSGLRRSWSTLPPDLQEQVRGRVRILAIILTIGFSFDPLTYWDLWLLAQLLGKPLDPGFYDRVGFQLINLVALAATLGLWWASRKQSVAPRTLLTVTLLYEVFVCFIIALLTYWQIYLDQQVITNLTWAVPVIILFPLVMPGPPRMMLAGAIGAAVTTPLALALLEIWGRNDASEADYSEATIGVTFAVIFAYLGARVVHRLGQEVAAARALGSYQLEERLGEGGMGEVWRARHRMLARPAAIKLIRPSLGEDKTGAASLLVKRFEREAQVIARLRSPHTVELFDFGVADNGAFYYAMELLEGLDADTLVRRYGPVPPERVIYLLRQVCHSLSEAESCGLVHRDIKPANVFLCRYGEDCDFVKVLDFGLVKAFDDQQNGGQALTRDMIVQGTPAFIAPEQVLGQVTDSRADIYATGCLAYWLLTGQLVFTGDTPMALLFHHANTPPQGPSSRSELPLPPALDQLVLSCLAKDPASRPQSARELGQRLDAIDGTGRWTADRAREWWNLHQPDKKETAWAPRDS
jgi:eukaryotic-like serine/threonine-protein kinase